MLTICSTNQNLNVKLGFIEEFDGTNPRPLCVKGAPRKRWGIVICVKIQSLRLRHLPLHKGGIFAIANNSTNQNLKCILQNNANKTA